MSAGAWAVPGGRVGGRFMYLQPCIFPGYGGSCQLTAATPFHTLITGPSHSVYGPLRLKCCLCPPGCQVRAATQPSCYCVSRAADKRLTASVALRVRPFPFLTPLLTPAHRLWTSQCVDLSEVLVEQGTLG